MKTPTYQAKFDPYYLHRVWRKVRTGRPRTCGIGGQSGSLPMYLTYGYDKGYDDCQFVITWMKGAMTTRTA